MALSNITLSTSTSNISVDVTNTTVSVGQTVSNVVIGNAIALSNTLIRSALSVTDTGGDGSLTYSNSTGVFTFTGPSAADVRAHFSNTAPILFDTSTGVISIDEDSIINETVVDNGNLSGNITLNIGAGRLHKVGLTGTDITGITLANISSGASATIIFTQDGSGGTELDTTTHASNWTAWEFANDFTKLDVIPNNWTVMNLFYDGTNYYASLVHDSAGFIENNELANSNVVINGVTIDLGSSGNIATTDLTSFSVTTNTPSGNGALAYNNTTGVFSFTPSDVPDTTDELTEGSTNLYFTTAAANSAIAGYTGAITNMTGNLTTTGIITGGASATDTHNLTGNLNVTGNVEVSGNLNYRNVEDLQVQNTELIMNANAATDATVSFVVNRPVAGSNTVLRWNETSDAWQFSNDGSTYFPIPTSTSDLNEGTNLYYTTDRANSAIEAHTGNIANLTGLLATTGNVQFNADTDVSGLSGLTFDSSTNNLGLGTPTPGAALHIRGTSNEAQIFMTEYNGTSSAGIDLRTFRAGGSEGSPSVTPKADRIWEALHYTYDGVGSSGDGVSTGFQNAFSEQIITDPSIDHAANLVPVFKQFHTYLDGDATTTPHALMRMRSNGDIQFNMTNAFSYTGAANTVISKDGIITTNGNVTSLANINAAGGTLTGILTSDSNVVTTAFFEGDLNGAVTIDVNNNTGSTLTKGEAVYLDGGNVGDTPNVALANSQVAANMPAIGIVRENIADQAIGQVVTSGVMNLASHGLTQGADIFIGTGGGITTTKPTGESALIQKIGKVVSANHIIVQGAFRTNATPNLDENNIFIGNAANQATTVSLTGLTSNVKTTGNLQVNPDTAVDGLTGLTFDTSTNYLGLGTTSPSAVIHITKDSGANFSSFKGTHADSSTDGIEFDFEKASGTLASPTAIGNNDLVQESRYFAHDGTSYIEAFSEYVYNDNSIQTPTTGNVSLTKEFVSKQDQDNFAVPVLTLQANGTVIFNKSSVKNFGSGSYPHGSANIDISGNFVTAGTIDATGNITSSGNISGNYILGNGSQLTGLASSTDSFGTITVAGQTNIQATQANAILDIASSGAITLTTSGNTLTIGGSGGSYGNSDVNNFLTNEGVSSTLKINTDDVSAIDSIHASNTATNGNDFARKKSRGTVASTSAVQDGDTIATDRFFGYDGDSYEDSFHANVYVDGTVSDGDVPMGMKFAPYSGVANPPAAIDMRANSEIKFAGGNASISSTGVLTANGSGLTNLTTSQITDFSSASNTAIENKLAAFTSDISTTSNVQINSETDVSGLSGLTFDTATNNLGLGTTTPKAALHIRGTSNEAQIYMSEFNGTSSAGVDFRTYSAGGDESSPTVRGVSDRIYERFHYAYDGVGSSGDGITTGFQTAFAEQVITDPSTSHSANVVPVFHQYYTYLDGDATSTPYALMRMRSNGDIQFNAGSAFSYTTAANTVISNAGEITTAGNITTTANISGNYILGNGSALTGIATDTFDQILVSGESNVDASGPTALTLAASGAITINTDAANNTVTIGGSGGSYGDSNVTSLLAGNTVTTNIVIQGDIQSDGDIKAANAMFADKIYSFTPGGTFSMNALRVTDFKANDPLGIDSVANSALSGGVYAAPFTGSIVYVTGDRHGSRGAPCYFDGTSWRYFSDDANVTI